MYPQRLRYNQFVRMLEAKGGWDVQPMERLHWMGATPFRWTQLILDKASTSAIRTVDGAASLAINAVNTIEGKLSETSSPEGATEGATQRLIDEIVRALRPLLDQAQPLTDKLTQFESYLLKDGVLADLVQTLQSYEQLTEAKIRGFLTPAVDSVTNAWLQIDQSVNLESLQSQISQFFDSFLPTPDELAAIKESSESTTSSPSFLDKLLPKLGLSLDEDSVGGDSSAEEAELLLQQSRGEFQSRPSTRAAAPASGLSQTERGGVTVPREDFQILKRRILESMPAPVKTAPAATKLSSEPRASTDQRTSTKSSSTTLNEFSDTSFIEDVVGEGAQSTEAGGEVSSTRSVDKVRSLVAQRRLMRVTG